MAIAPFFSIITASYNSAETITQTIESVLSQSFTDFEYIIVDGKSSDATIDIVKSFEPKFLERGISLRYISESDSGIYDAWNKGILMSKGTWISFLGSDDIYLIDALKQYHHQIEEHTEVNYISSRVDFVDLNRKRIKILGHKYDWSQLRRKMVLAQVGSFHHRGLFKEVGLFSMDYRIVSDYDFYLKSKDYIKPAFFDTITAVMSNGGISNQHYYKALLETLKVKKKHKVGSPITLYYDFWMMNLKCYVRSQLNGK